MYERPFPPQQPSPQGPQPYQPQQYPTPQQQAPQHPYQGPQNPYQGPQQGQQPTYQGPPHPYQGQQPPQQEPRHPHQGPRNPYEGPQHPYPPQPAPHAPYGPPTTAPRIPEEAGTMRRFGAILVDGLLALAAAFVALNSADRADLPALQSIYAVAGSGFGISFLNHVLLTSITGASLGKFAARTRVIRETDGSRPRLPRLFRRWLGGYLFLIVWIIAACFGLEDDPEDFCGIRLVRFRDLQTANGAPLH
ncbi:RDD family protein [Streptomyces sp. NPDC058773]|uniref:RDD family protein n=1 Tax=Streptomyces sp. NPDC058773 TaxID=3346632 RepID=UPI0036CB0084